MLELNNVIEFRDGKIFVSGKEVQKVICVDGEEIMASKINIANTPNMKNVVLPGSKISCGNGNFHLGDITNANFY